MRTSRSTRSTLAASTLAVAAVLAVAGCSDDEGHDMDSMSMSGHSMTSSATASTSTQTSAQFNSADVTFATDMYPHHAQAVDMAELVPDRSTNPKIISLARAIKTAQGPEMEQLAQWLQAWGQPAPSSSTTDDMGGMDHSGMSGMMSDQDMADLKSKSGSEFDQAWLTMMIDHHEGAVEMAGAEVAEGANAEAKTMAQNIITSQQAEIGTMRTLQK
ncbi:DUF305 domain-containing protein [Williamsia sp. 1135]|uniref:DUF305 domain-containing protein n=1 Tax=Williamsia sp. 1135 TaxID=1889262 RepID=UPI000A1171A4|nr:DUF305 domain-containing protein [Williamsia sp. 1135]ORM28772.1 DUF305 domain-containing protein [Williamsia sp. 1135]